MLVFLGLMTSWVGLPRLVIFGSAHCEKYTTRCFMQAQVSSPEIVQLRHASLDHFGRDLINPRTTGDETMLYYVRATLIPWYREEDYAEIRKIMRDGRRFPETFQKWLERSNRKFESLQAEGHAVARVYIDPDAFTDWCERRGLKLDTRARQAAKSGKTPRRVSVTAHLNDQTQSRSRKSAIILTPEILWLAFLASPHARSCRSGLRRHPHPRIPLPRARPVYAQLRKDPDAAGAYDECQEETFEWSRAGVERPLALLPQEFLMSGLPSTLSKPSLP